MAKFYWSVWCRSQCDRLVAAVPTPWLRYVFKTFKERPGIAEAAGFQVYPYRFDAPLPILEECLLSGGDRYQIELPLHCLVREHEAAMKQFFPRGRHPGQSLWMRKVR
jgi:hypothetical protein